jgi:LmbE family N-acetylglucosaminyl deacetylase
MEEKICLVIVAHPDDAELAMGGTLLRYKAEGVRTIVAVLSTGLSDDVQKDRRRYACQESADTIGYELVWPYNLEKNQVEDIKTYDLVSKIDSLITKYSPDLIYSHWEYDSHEDHRRTAEAVLASSRITKADIIAFPPADLSTSQAYAFSPNYFVDISEFANYKYSAIEIYNYIDRGYRSLNMENYKKRDSSIGIITKSQYAEAFQIRRKFL